MAVPCEKIGIMIQYDANGVLWLEPKHLDLNAMARDIEENDSDHAAAKYSLSPTEWKEALEGIVLECEKGRISCSSKEIINALVNAILARYALCFPSYGTAPELHDVHRLITKTHANIAAAQKIIFAAVMCPRIRALQLVGRFMKLSPFNEFAYLIDAATLCFYRGNIPSTFMTIIPVVEGILLRWQGYPGAIAKKPSFKKTLKFVREAPKRQPMPFLVPFFQSWLQTAESILTNHLYHDTSKGPSFNHFNRHLALHLLEDQKFATRENGIRAFLLIDVLSDLFICENRLKDPRWDTKPDEESPHIKAYNDALLSHTYRNQPERILGKTHVKCKDV